MNMTIPNILLVIIFFQCLPDIEDRLQKEAMNVPQRYMAVTLIDLGVHVLLKDWKELSGRSSFTDVYKAVAPCTQFDNGLHQFQVLAMCIENLS